MTAKISSTPPPYMLKLIHLRYPPGYVSSTNPDFSIFGDHHHDEEDQEAFTLNGQLLNAPSSTTPGNKFNRAANPPSFTPKSFTILQNGNQIKQQRNTKLSNVFQAVNSKESTLMLTTSPNDLNDTLHVFDASNFPYRQVLMESKCSAVIDGKIWALQEITQHQLRSLPFSIFSPFQHDTDTGPGDGLTGGNKQSLHIPALNIPLAYQTKFKFVSRYAPSNSNLLDTKHDNRNYLEIINKPNLPLVSGQLYRDSRRFIMITSQKVIRFEISNPSDFLKTLLLANNGNFDDNSIKTYLFNMSRHYSPKTMTTSINPSLALVNCLHLLCTLGPGENQIGDWVIQLLNKYGSSNGGESMADYVRDERMLMRTARKDDISSLSPSHYYLPNKQQKSSSTTIGGILKRKPSVPGSTRPGTFFSSTPHNRGAAITGRDGRILPTGNNPPSTSKFFQLELPPPMIGVGGANKSYLEPSFTSFANPPFNNDSYSFQDQTHQFQTPKRYKLMDETGVPVTREIEPFITITQETLLRYFWRIVRPIWNFPFCITFLEILSTNGISPSQIISTKLITDTSYAKYVTLLLNGKQLTFNSPITNLNDGTTSNGICENETASAAATAASILEEELILKKNPEIFCDKLIIPFFNVIDFTALADRLEKLLFVCERYRNQILLPTPPNLVESLYESAGNLSKYGSASFTTNPSLEGINGYDVKPSLNTHKSLDSSTQMMDISGHSINSSHLRNSLSSNPVGRSGGGGGLQPVSVTFSKRKNVTFASDYSPITNEYQKHFSDTFADNFLTLVKRSKELAVLWKLLLDYCGQNTMISILSTMTDDDRNLLLSTPFYSFVTDGGIDGSSCKDRDNFYRDFASYNDPLQFYSKKNPSSSSSNQRHLTPLLNRLIFATCSFHPYSATTNNTADGNYPSSLIQPAGLEFSEILNKKIRECCPSFYGPDQALITQANQNLVKAMHDSDNHYSEFLNFLDPADTTEISLFERFLNVKSRCLLQSLQLYLRTDPDELDLQLIHDHYTSAGYYLGIICLCLHSSAKYKIHYQRIDKFQAASSVSRNNSVPLLASRDFEFYFNFYREKSFLYSTTEQLSPHDVIQRIANEENIPVQYYKRLVCYGFIFSALSRLFDRIYHFLPKTSKSSTIKDFPSPTNIEKSQQQHAIQDYLINVRAEDSSFLSSSFSNPNQDATAVLPLSVLKKEGGLPMFRSYLGTTDFDNISAKFERMSLLNKLRLSFLNVLGRCLEADDELFSYILYDWLIQKGLNEFLVKCNSPFLETYLNNVTDSSKYQISRNNCIYLLLLDLKCRYLESRKYFVKSAIVLNTLAECADPNLNLDQRLDYFSRALILIRTSLTMDNDSGHEMIKASQDLHLSYSKKEELMQELQDKIDVLQIQVKVQNALKTKYGLKEKLVQSSINQLNERLFDLTELYQNFTERFELWECQLEIFHAANYTDRDLIRIVWTKILNEAATLTAAGNRDYLTESADTSLFLDSRIMESTTFSSGNRYGNNLKPVLDKVYKLGLIYFKGEKESRNNGYFTTADGPDFNHPYFPMKFLVRYLEMKSYEDSTTTNLAVPQTFMKLDVPCDYLLKIYTQLYTKKQKNEGFGMHLASITLLLITFILDNLDRVTIKNRYNLNNQALNFTSTLSIDLQNSTYTRKSSISDLLTKIQSRLNAY